MNAEIIYHINAADTLISANDAWDDFAIANDAAQVKREHVLGKVLWQLLSDPTTSLVYHQVCTVARGGVPLRFVFRCDSPGVRRLLEMDVLPHPAGQIEFRTRAISETPCDPTPLLAAAAAAPREARELLRVCSWCNNFFAGGHWVGVSEAILKLGLMTHSPMPMITHGVCESCKESLKQAVDEMKQMKRKNTPEPADQPLFKLGAPPSN